MIKKFLSSIQGSIIVASLIISLSILVGSGVIQIKGTRTIRPTTTVPSATTQPAAAAPTEDSGPAKVSVDDDPVLGDKNAPVTIIEFSDYECPFCKRHFDQTHPQLIKNYVDTGKVKIVFRDLPLSFHDPLATTEAIAANCVREQGGDSAYFKYHDLMFKNTTSNGNGLTKEDLSKYVSDIGLNPTTFKVCLDAEKFKQEVQSDLADAGKVGASGTPTFFIGKSTSDGVIDGTRVVGAQPYSVFQTTIDGLLK
jgi:protein-disulfide isomerase